MSLNRTVTSEILVAYSRCPRKAFLIFCTDKKGTPHEYVGILERHKNTNRRIYLSELERKMPNIQDYDICFLQGGSDMIINATLRAEGLEAGCDLLTKVETSSSLGEFSYEPTICVGTHSVSKEQRLELFFAGYVLGQIQGKVPAAGRIIVMGQKSRKVKLENSGKALMPLLEDLREWAGASSSDLPPLILNKHCPLCQFCSLCRAKAEQEDHLSLLDQISTPKAVQKYEKKGIFTVNQLSYLYKPRRRRKRTRNPPKLIYKPELQALAIRTGKIYLQELPELSRQPVELFLDIEGIPDQQIYYLIGLLVCKADTCEYHSFWADSSDDEAQIWQQFLAKANECPNAPIYHYGSYEPRAIAKLSRRYDTDGENLKSRLVNVNAFVYARVYFPVWSNRLKEIGDFIGATWTASNASGLQSLVWRHHWSEARDAHYHDLLMIYNEEDCLALKLLIDELSKITQSANTLFAIDFADRPKRHATEEGRVGHSQFESILKFAHSDYDKRKISFQQDENEQGTGGKEEKKTGSKRGYQGHRKVKPKAMQVIQVAQREFCPKCENALLRATDLTSKRLIIDLVSTRNGLGKTITEYVGANGYCPSCYRYFTPPDISKYQRNQLYGRGFKAWLVYLRVALRMPYRTIIEIVEEQFNEKVSEASIPVFISNFARYYDGTEKVIIQRLLKSPFLHVDETPINTRGGCQYVWVFTDGKDVTFKLTETRESTVVHKFLTDYNGILISDFYPGYDSVRCRQQKCWSHLIRDLDDDLWKAPFDIEFGMFVLEVRDLLLPIMEAVQEYGLKRKYLFDFKLQVDEFYEKVITTDKRYKSEVALKYQKRFARYRDSLFTFLEQDGLPWHNNTAERALRHLAIQEKISGFFFESVLPDYLRLLGIRQACRFREESFFKFLRSGEKDIVQSE